jgi:D-alanine--poly(phosphoribitol) ligase subunit 1
MNTHTLADLLSLPLATCPDAVALKAPGQQISFIAIERQARALAVQLIAAFGVRPGDRIVVLADKRPTIVVTAYAIWKAGGVYVPVDAKSPALRLRQIVGSIQPRLLVASERALGELGESFECVPAMTFEQIDQGGGQLTSASLPVVSEGAPAVIIHTSGSTGIPKGAVLTHSSVVTYLHNHNEYLRFGVGSVGINNSPFHFDVSIQDTFLPLYFGASIVFHRDVFLSSVMIELILRNRVTHLIAVSSVLDLISRDARRFAELARSSVQVMVTGGEVCPPGLINRWLDTVPGLRVLYGYGPTECNSLCMTSEIVSPEVGRTAPYPIGVPFRGMKAALFDESGNIISQADEPGVLGISGAQVMTGYWNDPEMTARVLREVDGDVYYISGDYCVRDSRGVFCFVGRTDSEVKIRGRRINLNEVRNALMSPAGVGHVAVGTVETQGELRIAAFVTADAGATTREDLRGAAACRLLDYMRPFYIALAEAAPRTASGKVNDKLALEILRQAILRNPTARDVDVTASMTEAMPIGELAV